MSSQESPGTCFISMVGPSRIGKTTLITALLEAGQQCFEGTNVSLKVPVGSVTEKRVSMNRRELESHIRARTFDPGGIRGTSELFIYELVLDPQVPGYEIEVKIADFPGGWLDPVRRPPGTDWERVLQYFTRSAVLAVPIDATVLMEANQPAHQGAWPHLLLIKEVEDVVREWAKTRAQYEKESREVFLNQIWSEILSFAENNLTEKQAADLKSKLSERWPQLSRSLEWRVPAVLVLAPLKCETYFPDAGGRKDSIMDNIADLGRRIRLRNDPKELRNRVEDLYGDIVEVAKSEYPKVEILYCAIDSIGCVEVEQSHWEKQGDQYYFHCSFRVRPPYKRCPRMADVIIRLIAYNFVNLQAQISQARQLLYEALGQVAQEIYPTGFFSLIWAWISGNLSKIDRVTQHSRELSETEQWKLEQLMQRLNELGDVKRYVEENSLRCYFLHR